MKKIIKSTKEPKRNFTNRVRLLLIMPFLIISVIFAITCVCIKLALSSIKITIKWLLISIMELVGGIMFQYVNKDGDVDELFSH